MNNEIVIRIIIETQDQPIKIAEVNEGGPINLDKPVTRDQLAGEILKAAAGKPVKTKKIYGILLKKFHFCENDKAHDGTMIRWQHKTLSAIHQLKVQNKIKKQRGVIEII